MCTTWEFFGVRIGGLEFVPLLKLCSKCGDTMPVGKPRCPRCEAKYRKQTNAVRNQRPQMRFYQSAAWRKVRALVIARDGNQCTRCGSTRDLTAHHLIYDDPLDPSTLTTLCRSCHGRATRHTAPCAASAGLGVGRAGRVDQPR
jgi:5-methylcytosine-specific restriction endonuclease McrA